MAQVDHGGIASDAMEEGEPSSSGSVPVPHSFVLRDPGDCVDVPSTRKAIERLQAEIRRFTEQYPSSDRILSTEDAQMAQLLRTRQEKLFGELLVFQEVELNQLEQSLNEVEKIEDNDVPQFQLVNVQNTCNDLVVWKDQLESIVNSPKPMCVDPSLDSDSPPDWQVKLESKLEESCGKAQMLLLQCQGLLSDYSQLKESLVQQMHSKRDKSLSDLESLENWLGQVYALLCLEPSKMWLSVSDLSPWHQPKKEPPSPRRVSFEESSVLSQPSDDSLLEDLEASPGRDQSLDKSVNPSLQDSQYMEEVTNMVISSPSDNGDGEEDTERGSSVDDHSTVCTSEGQVPSLADELREAGWEFSPSPPRRPPQSTAGSGGSDFGGSLSSPVELSPDVDGISLDVPSETTPSSGMSPDVTELSLDASPDLKGASIGVVPKSTESHGTTSGARGTAATGVKRALFNMSDASPDRMHSRNGKDEVDHWRKPHPPRVAPLDAAVEAPPLVITLDEGGSQTVSAKSLAFVRLKHSSDCELGKESSGYLGLSTHDLESVLLKLKEVFEEIGEKSNRSKATAASVGHYMSNALKDESERTHLRERLAFLSGALDPLKERVGHRIAQLKFEKIQKAILDELLEAERDLDSQSITTNQTREVIQLNLSSFKEFFTSPEHFSAQLEGQLKEMEATMEQLVLSGREDASLLQRTHQQLKDTCHGVCSKAREHFTFLELCAAQWTEFDQCCSCLGDWLNQAEEKVQHQKYGSTLEEVASFGDTLEDLTKELPLVDSNKVLPLKESGDVLIKSLDPKGPAHIQVQDTLSDLLGRWHTLCTQLEKVQQDVSSVLIGWKGYNGVKEGLTGFLNNMLKALGSNTEASSDGDLSQLNAYKAHVTRVQEMEKQFDNLKDLGGELVSNARIPAATELITREVEDLEHQWSAMKDTVLGKLKGLKQDLEHWVMGKVTSLKKLVEEEDNLLSKMIDFVEGFPHKELLLVDLTDVRIEVDKLSKYEERLDQLDNDFMSLEDEIQNVPHEELSESLAKEISGFQTYHYEVQQHLQTMGSVINTLQMYITLAQKIQVHSSMVMDALKYFGSALDLESERVTLQLQLSEDSFSAVEQEASDLDSILEQYEYESLVSSSDMPCNIPPVEDLVETNRTFASALREISSKAKLALERFQHLIGQWSLYEEGKQRLMPWMEGVEQRMNQLVARGEDDCVPHVSPHDLLSETKELLTEVNGEKKVVDDFFNTGQAIAKEMVLSNMADDNIRAEVLSIRSQLEHLSTTLERFKEQCEQKQYNYDQFLTSLGDVNVKLCAFEYILQDEFGEIDSRKQPAENMMSSQKGRLKGLSADLSKLTETYNSLCQEGIRWNGYLVHTDFLPNFAPVRCSDQDQIPTVETIVDLVKKKWCQVQSVLAQKRDQLEMVTGDIATFMKALSSLLSWLRESPKKEEVVATPTRTDQLRSFINVVQLLSSEMNGRKQEEKETLHQRYEVLKSQLSQANSRIIEQEMIELQVKWSELCRILPQRASELCSYRDKAEHFWMVFGEVEGWLLEAEKRYTECGPIGAHLERLLEQGPILQAIDEDFLAHKENPDRVCAEAARVGEIWGGGREELTTKAEQLRKRFEDFSERLVEQRELREEAVSAMQQFQTEYDSFEKWLGEAADKHKQWTEKKAPIGTIGGELEEYYDFMREVESHTKQYSSLRGHSEQLMSKYKPSEHLEGMMVSMHTRWEGFVAVLDQFCKEKHALKGRWEELEKEVKELLGWMTQEANKFSREVTEKGEKGIEDHVESCQVPRPSWCDESGQVYCYSAM